MFFFFKDYGLRDFRKEIYSENFGRNERERLFNVLESVFEKDSSIFAELKTLPSLDSILDKLLSNSSKKYKVKQLQDGRKLEEGSSFYNVPEPVNESIYAEGYHNIDLKGKESPASSNYQNRSGGADQGEYQTTSTEVTKKKEESTYAALQDESSYN